MMNRIMAMTEEDFRALMHDRRKQADLLATWKENYRKLKEENEKFEARNEELKAKNKELREELSAAEGYAVELEGELKHVRKELAHYEALSLSYRDLFNFESSENKRLRKKYGAEDPDIRY